MRKGLPRVVTLLLLLCVTVPALGTVAPAKEGDEKGEAHSGEEVLFDIWEYRVDGSKLLGVSEIERIVYPFLGPERAYEDVESAREALQGAYREKGYTQVLVDIPVQDVNEGVVRLVVVEPEVENSWVSGSRYFSPRKIKRQLAALGKGAVINEDQVNQQLNSVNRRNPDLQVVPVLRPGVAPGTVEVELKVRDELPLHADLELNNQHTSDTTDLRLKGTASYGNLWQADHKLTLLGLVSPQDTSEVKVFSASYMMPVGSGENKLLLSAMHTDSSVETIGDITVVGKGDIFSANLIKPLEPVGGLYGNLIFGAEYRQLENQDPVSTETIDYLSFSAAWMGSMLHPSGATTGFDLGITFGFEGLVNDQREFETERVGSKPGFALVNASLDHQRKLPWESTLSARVSGQLSPIPLISNLQTSAGGAGSVRGYYEAQELADNGVRGSLEWTTPNLGGRLREAEESKAEIYLSAFTEGAWLWDNTPTASGKKRFRLASVGLGSEVRAFDGLFASLDVAWPLVKVGTVDKGEAMAHFRLGYEF